MENKSLTVSAPPASLKWNSFSTWNCTSTFSHRQNLNISLFQMKDYCNAQSCRILSVYFQKSVWRRPEFPVGLFYRLVIAISSHPAVLTFDNFSQLFLDCPSLSLKCRLFSRRIRSNSGDGMWVVWHPAILFQLMEIICCFQIRDCDIGLIRQWLIS
jgi:hypothetical protein